GAQAGAEPANPLSIEARQERTQLHDVPSLPRQASHEASRGASRVSQKASHRTEKRYTGCESASHGLARFVSGRQADHVAVTSVTQGVTRRRKSVTPRA